MASEYIEKIAKGLMQKFCTSDPYEIAECLGIKVQEDDIGSLKGMYVYIKRNRYIVLSSALSDNMKKLVLAHELGHDQLHRDMAKYNFIHDSNLNDMTSKPEYEANVFAATLLVDDDRFLSMIGEETLTLEDLASNFGVDANIVALKGRLLTERGVAQINVFEHQSNFLK